MPVTIKRDSQNFAAVILLQAMLEELNYSVVIDGRFDRSLEQAVEQFQLANNLVVDGIVGPKTWQVLYLGSTTYLATSSGRFIEEIDLINAAKTLKIEVATIKAVNEVESKGMGFINDFPVILFERHIFWRRLEAYGLDPSALVDTDNQNILSKTPGGYRSSIKEIKRLQRAQLIHNQAALESASWGIFQVMGFHWRVLGYQSIEYFVECMKKSEVEHLDAFVRYMKKNNLHKKLQLKNGQQRLQLSHFKAFAKGYNGKDYAINRYDTKMFNAYKRYRQKEKILFSGLANIFINTGYNQDRIHNAILEQLLTSFYSVESVSKKEPEHSQAYNAVRDNKLNHPLYQIRQSADLENIDPNNTDFFVRDFIQVYSKGGVNAQEPMVIGTPSQNSNERNGFNIFDGILESSFAQYFNWMIEEVNKILVQQNINQKVRGLAQMAHRDAIQLIPFSPTISHFAGATMQYIQVVGNQIHSKGSLQGIFATDGAFKQLHICNNSIDIQGQHSISISGMLSGAIDGNTDAQLQPLAKEKITLSPLRIGGGANIYILSFKNADHLSPEDYEYYAYEKITGTQAITDLRKVAVNKPNASNWKNVDMPALQALYNQVSEQVKQLMAQGASQQQIKQKWLDMMLQVGEKA